jgi:hypothetical protein
LAFLYIDGWSSAPPFTILLKNFVLLIESLLQHHTFYINENDNPQHLKHIVRYSQITSSKDIDLATIDANGLLTVSTTATHLQILNIISTT